MVVPFCIPTSKERVFLWTSLATQLVKNPPAMGETWLDPWVRKIPWRREKLPTPLFWAAEFNGLYSPWGCKESDMTERLSLHFTSIPVDPDPHQHLVLSAFWSAVIIIGEQWCLIVLMCDSLMICDTEYFFICLFAICASSLVRCLSRSLAPFKNWLFSIKNIAAFL